MSPTPYSRYLHRIHTSSHFDICLHMSSTLASIHLVFLLDACLHVMPDSKPVHQAISQGDGIYGVNTECLLASEISDIDRELSLNHRSTQISLRNTSANSAHAAGYLQWPPKARRHAITQHKALLCHSKAYFLANSVPPTHASVSVSETVVVFI
jgi:hypothetical protein